MSGVKMQVTSLPCLKNAPFSGIDMPFIYEVSFKVLFPEIDPNSASMSADDSVMALSGKILQMQNNSF